MNTFHTPLLREEVHILYTEQDLLDLNNLLNTLIEKFSTISDREKSQCLYMRIVNLNTTIAIAKHSIALQALQAIPASKQQSHPYPYTL